MSIATSTPTHEAAFADFETEARARGFDEVLERPWAPDTVVDTHTHPFSVWARVARGELWLTVGDEVHHLPAGAEFTLDALVPHAERYGAEGTLLWVGRRHVPR